MNELKDFFVASVGAAAALIGLLFVAVTIAPDRIFGGSADYKKRSQAIGGFAALVNVFFVSLTALIPRDAVDAIMVIAAVSLFRTGWESITMSRLFPDTTRGWHRYGLLSMAIYALELAFAARIALFGAESNGLVFVIVGLYSYALGTAWNLLGAHDVTEA